ncbi:MAG: DUF4011 domain-containing protein [Methylobacteriaceae bacterium]|nr:DUF4011 domain-containing protein [Methylobacteriaceae bacterium]
MSGRIRTQGVNILYLALGALRWINPNNANKVRFAPLVLVTVALDRGTAERWSATLAPRGRRRGAPRASRTSQMCRAGQTLLRHAPLSRGSVDRLSIERYDPVVRSTHSAATRRGRVVDLAAVLAPELENLATAIQFADLIVKLRVRPRT